MFSIIIPLDPIRFHQFARSKRAYDAMPQTKEFLIITRNPEAVKEFLANEKLAKQTRVIGYELSGGFNVSKALNIGVRNAKYDQVIITSPEVKPLTDVLAQFSELVGQNVVAQVFDEDEEGDTKFSLVNHQFRSRTPAMYFLAMFNKADIEKINGWDEEFLRGYAYEDDDFGERWVRAELPFVIREDIRGVHQYHPRRETIPGGTDINRRQFELNNSQAIIRPKNGLRRE